MEAQSIIVHPSKLTGSVHAPAGKSMMQRALVLALLHQGKTTIVNPGKSEDDLHMMQMIASLGAKIKETELGLEIIGPEVFAEVDMLHCGESGLALRMIVPVLAIGNKTISVNGEGSLIKRKHQFPIDVFSMLNISMTQSSHGLPIVIKGPIVPVDCIIPANESSQYVTGLLIALGYVAKDKIEVKFDRPVSKPYIQLTLDMMRQFGYVFEQCDTDSVSLYPRDKSLLERKIVIEGDWSGGSFLILAAILSGGFVIGGLEEKSIQADRKIIEVLEITGTMFKFEGDRILIQKNHNIMPFCFDATDCPDLFPVLAVLASYAEGKSRIKGVNRLFNKESDRAFALVENLSALGINIQVEDDEMHIVGQGKISGGKVDSFNDHRIAMAMACAALRAEAPIIISHADCINKSYPAFYSHLCSLGAQIQSSFNYSYS